MVILKQKCIFYSTGVAPPHLPPRTFAPRYTVAPPTCPML